MKPEKWDEWEIKEQEKYAIQMFQSHRGNYLISQALFRAIEVMKKDPPKKRETSNIEDMETLSVLFPLFFMLTKLEKEQENKKC
ncbi:hypothetical protein KAR91_81595 [Candidatus Pacearchaeota archaeon]|nr:hypothetical protein [Candidatus Pacearchaeota archaeon]